MVDELKFIWLPTFADRPNDFAGWDGGRMFGRVFYSQYGWWHWHLSGPTGAAMSGRAQSEHDAKLAAEAEHIKSTTS